MEKHVYDRESSFGKRHSNANKKMCNMDDDGEDEDDSKKSWCVEKLRNTSKRSYGHHDHNRHHHRYHLAQKIN